MYFATETWMMKLGKRILFKKLKMISQVLKWLNEIVFTELKSETEEETDRGVALSGYGVTSGRDNPRQET